MPILVMALVVSLAILRLLGGGYCDEEKVLAACEGIGLDPNLVHLFITSLLACIVRRMRRVS